MTIKTLITQTIIPLSQIKAVNNDTETILCDSDTVATIVKGRFGTMSAVNDDGFIDMFNTYIRLNQNNTNKAYASLCAEYEPLDNNAVTTQITETTNSNGTPSTFTSTSSERSFDSDTMTETQSSTTTGTTTTANSTHEYTELKHGNISATTNQSIISQELELRINSFVVALIERAVYFGGVYYDN